MTEMILDIQTLPETILSKISTQKVKFYEENGIITVTPFSDEKPHKSSMDHLLGIFSDGKMSVDKFLLEKRQEMELEL